MNHSPVPLAASRLGYRVRLYPAPDERNEEWCRVHGTAIIYMSKLDRFYMSEALKEAEKAFDAQEVPVGAVIVHEGRVIGRAHNQIKLLKDPTAHAEIIAITQAASYLGSERLINTTIYVTIEPCAMCAGALVLARVKRLVYGANDPKTGACGSVFNIADNKRLNHRLKITKGLLEYECSELLKGFFKKKRKSGEVA